MKLENGTVMNLDTTGLFYSSVATKNHPGTFGVRVCLNEDIHVSVLQQAVKNLYKRLPHFNVAIVHEDNQNKNIKLEDDVIPQFDEEKVFCAYFEEGKVTSRVLYGKNSITMEVLHSVCDGGTLTKAIKALTIEYFNLLGVKTPYQEISLEDEFSMDEIENAVKKYADEKAEASFVETPSVYTLSGTKAKSHLRGYALDCSKVKMQAKEKGVTVTEYIIANMILAFDEARKARKDTKPICINIPLDCRKYFPSNTLRNFVIAFNVIVDQWNSFEDLLAQIHQQMSSIDEVYVQNYLNTYAKIDLLVSPNSYEETKNSFLEFEKKTGGESMTAVISNVGLVRFDSAIQNRIHHMEFTLCPEEHCPYQFASITCGNILYMNVTVGIEEEDVLNSIMEKLK